MRRFLTFLLLLSLFSKVLFSQTKTIELVANFPVEIEHLTSILKAKNADALVVASDLHHYGIGIKKTPRFIAKWMHKWSLDFWKSIPVKPEIAKIIFFNLSNHLRRDFNLNYMPKDKLCLFMWEPPVVLPQMYKQRTFNFFSKIYTWDDDLVDGIKFFKFYYPVLRSMILQLPAFEEKKFCTFVGTCLQSDRAGCLYKERKKAIAFFEQIGEEGFEFYGKKWDCTLYKSYRGPIADKIETIKNYRFSICYENCCDRNGYVTEKIFDCFAAGCIPIYWGAPNIERYVPQDCFIDRRQFKSMDELYVFLKNMNKEEYEGYLKRIRIYLKSDKAQLFSFPQFEKTFFEAAGL